MKRNACLVMLLTVSLTAGCVERRFVVHSDPPARWCITMASTLAPRRSMVT